jgi:hypothetical protein
MATWNSTGADVGTNSVQDMHDNHAANGDTITIPANQTFTWNTGVVLSKAITLTSANVPANTDAIINASNFLQPTSTLQFGAGNLSPGIGTPLIQINASSSGSIIIAGLNFLQGSVNDNQSSFVKTNGTTNFPIVMHDCMFNPNGNGGLLHTCAWFSGNGLIYHCHVNGIGGTFNAGNNSNPGTGTGGIYFQSDTPWWQQDSFGTLDVNGTINTYVESCLLSNMVNQCLDIGESARVVARDCMVNNSQFLTHGSTGISGGRQAEFYNNAFNYYPVFGTVNPNSGAWNKGVGDAQNPSDGSVWPQMSRWMWFRAGTGRIHDNTVVQIYSHGAFDASAAFAQLTAESMARSSAQAPCENPPPSWGQGWHWPGNAGSVDPASPHLNDGTYSNVGTNYHTSGYQILDAIYLWNNTWTGNGVLPASGQVNMNDETGNCGTSNSGAVLLVNQNYFTNTPPPTGAGYGPLSSANLQTYTYAPFQYPHPLRTGGGGGGVTQKASITVVAGLTSTAGLSASPKVVRKLSAGLK